MTTIKILALVAGILCGLALITFVVVALKTKLQGKASVFEIVIVEVTSIYMLFLLGYVIAIQEDRIVFIWMLPLAGVVVALNTHRWMSYGRKS